MSQVELEKAAEDVKKLTKEPSNNELLQLYGLYKRKNKIHFKNTSFI